ncbi:MAG: ATP-binding protein [Bacteroidales bacterium]|jgi:predicted AAA+ superfamily ATPase|nr:ATP-binding protein [Bacteroidales bacterium]MBP8982267.1 ATP-binding protein [Bacteroidales bacterium]HPY58777.1 ATP-binding protein [Bacteroidales bacterium]HQB71021.1 ATP-binding protein [Bacteroidales bacterium]
MFYRSYLETVKKRIQEPRKFIQVILGPRQVGKTTMITQLLSQLSVPNLYESADAIPVTNSVWLTQLWEAARLQIKVSGATEYLIVIDEIQKIDNWSEIVKQQWDKDTRERTNIKVILLGSSRLLIQQGLTESLAGRFETMYLGHWTYTEMQEAFGWSIEQYVYFGGYPGSATLIDDEERWKNYIKDSLIETSISKDILMLTRVNKPALLKRLFELGSLYSGQVLSYTKIIGQLQDAGNTTTLANYLKLLSDCGLLGGLDKYAGDIIRKRGSSPKFQVYNNALITSQANDAYEKAIINPELWGRLVESSVGTHLINNSIPERYNLYYWREGNHEVDFILEKGDKVIGLEVKSGMKAENTGMGVFAEKFHPEKVLLVGTGGIPYEEFLKINPRELF